MKTFFVDFHELERGSCHTSVRQSVPTVTHMEEWSLATSKTLYIAEAQWLEMFRISLIIYQKLTFVQLNSKVYPSWQDWNKVHSTNWQSFFNLLKFIMLTIKVKPELCIFASERKATQNLLVWRNSATAHVHQHLSVWLEWQAGNIVEFQATE